VVILFRQFPAAGRGCGLEQLELSFQAGQSFAVAGNVQLQALYVVGQPHDPILHPCPN
jgi:hypothetical protein